MSLNDDYASDPLMNEILMYEDLDAMAHGPAPGGAVVDLGGDEDEDEAPVLGLDDVLTDALIALLDGIVGFVVRGVRWLAAKVR